MSVLEFCVKFCCIPSTSRAVSRDCGISLWSDGQSSRIPSRSIVVLGRTLRPRAPTAKVTAYPLHCTHELPLCSPRHQPAHQVLKPLCSNTRSSALEDVHNDARNIIVPSIWCHISPHIKDARSHEHQIYSVNAPSYTGLQGR